ncbi:late competence development ComFB family protein [Myxosarcina sp. GI1]|uniref:late competence development ComFB family protein n=1 Tax=Myxosarcina sp. GI1 TaxID=1541065 RepID=UPI00068A8FE7|nr:late competence development ComFB family protein [Myxosarcina sp. GI1]
MSKKVINLTLPIVEREIDLLLEMYPHKLHQLQLNNSDLRQELIAYILNRIPSVYGTINDGALDNCDRDLEAFLEYQIQIEALVFQGIDYLVPAKHLDRICD